MSMHIPLSSALFTKTQARVLGVLFGRPEQTFYLTEIVRRAQVGRGSVQRELDRLVKSGLVTARSIGNQRHFQANARCPIFNELHGIVMKTSGIADALRDALNSLGNGVSHAFVFGSIAANTAKPGSDIDLMVVGDVSFTAVVHAFMNVHDQLGREVNPVVMTMDEFRRKVLNRDRFAARVWKEPKIYVKGDHDELEQSVEDRAAD